MIWFVCVAGTITESWD